MAISVECPACEHDFSVPDEYAGKKGKCPECRNIFQAPTASEARKQQPSPPVPATAEPSAATKQTTSGLKIPTPKRLAGRAAETDAVPPPPLDGEPVHVAPPLGSLETYGDIPPEPLPSVDAKLPSVSTSREPAPKADGGPRPVRRPSRAPLWIALCLLVVGLLGGGGAFAFVALNSRDKDDNTVADKDKSDKTEEPDDDDTVEEPDDPKAVSQPDRVAHEQLVDLLETAHKSIYSLRAVTDGNERYGVGFLVDERGWIATSYHLIDGAQLLGIVEISLTDPSGFGDRVFPGPQDGLVAVDPEHDLAILSFESLRESGTAVLDLSSVTTLPADERLASWHNLPIDLDASSFLGMTPGSELPTTAKDAVRDRKLNGITDLVWIEHTVPAQPDDAGAPLFNAAGEVVGINVPLGMETKNGYAIPITHLIKLIANADGSIAPESPDLAGATDPDPMPPETQPEVKPELGSMASVDYIAKVHEEVKAMEWKAASNDDYAKLQDLIEYVLAAQRADENTKLAEGEQVIVGFAAEAVMSDLNERQWPTETEIAEFNALAVAGLETPGRPLIAYTKVVLTSLQSKRHNDVPTVAFNLLGTDSYVVLPVTENARALTKGSRWQLIARHDDSAADLTIEVGIRLKTEHPAALIQAKYLIGEPKPVEPKPGA